MKKSILVLGLVFSLLSSSGNLFAKEKRGAELEILKKDGRALKGELIAVKPSSLLLLDSQTGADASVEIGDISVIKIMRKSKAWVLGATGFFLGAACGIGYGGVIDRVDEVDTSVAVYFAIAALFGAMGAIPGTIVGAYLGKDKIIRLEGKPTHEMNAIMEKLRGQSRIADF